MPQLSFILSHSCTHAITLPIAHPAFRNHHSFRNEYRVLSSLIPESGLPHETTKRTANPSPIFHVKQSKNEYVLKMDMDRVQKNSGQGRVRGSCKALYMPRFRKLYSKRVWSQAKLASKQSPKFADISGAVLRLHAKWNKIAGAVVIPALRLVNRRANRIFRSLGNPIDLLSKIFEK